MFKTARVLLCLSVFAAGCKNLPPRPTGEKPPDWDAAHDQPQTSEPTPATRLPATPTRGAALQPPATPEVHQPEARPLPATPQPLSPEQTWISLSRWAAQRGFEPPHCLAVAPTASFSQTTTNGSLLVQEGSLAAFWDQMEFRLGFNPQFISGQIFLHTLDLEKNIHPLLQSSKEAPKTNRVIVLDPGHGGLNSGTRSAEDGRWEKEFTLDWAQRLVPLLENAGWRVFLTRTKDEDVSLPDRVAFAERQQADLFVSLHFNSSGNGTTEQAGLETYCLTPATMPSSLTRGYSDDPDQVYPNNAYDTENLQYAARLHRSLLKVASLADRGVRRARYQGVVRVQKRPAVLIEGGYLSNPTEARRIADPAFRQQLAEAVVQALK